MTQLRDLKPGDRFWFKGDWQTEPSEWTVLHHDSEIGMTRCDSNVHEESWFHNIRVEVLGNDTQATA